jgi:hypothetical protein
MPRKPSDGNQPNLEVEFSPGKVTDPSIPLRDVLLGVARDVREKANGSTRKIRIRPGIMVSLKPRNRGGVSYVRTDLEKEVPGVGGSLVEEWRTRKVVESPEETDRAKRTIGKAASLVRAVCVSTNFGLLCPLDREGELDAAWREARRLVEEHNATAETTHLAIYMMKGQVAGTDEEAARSITEEVRGLVEQMNSGIDRLDVEVIREAASKAKQLEEMMEAEQAATVGAAVKAARSAARLITKRAGEDPKLVLLDVQRGDLEKARMAFLDLGEDAEVGGEVMPAANVQRFAAIEDDGEQEGVVT